MIALEKSSGGKIDKNINIIDKKIKKDVKQILYSFGFHRVSLFPDLESLTAPIEWMKRDTY